MPIDNTSHMGEVKMLKLRCYLLSTYISVLIKENICVNLCDIPIGV